MIHLQTYNLVKHNGLSKIWQINDEIHTIFVFHRFLNTPHMSYIQSNVS